MKKSLLAHSTELNSNTFRSANKAERKHTKISLWLICLLLLGGMFGANPSYGLTATYNATTMINMPYNCGTGGYYTACDGSYPGFSWVDNLPSGAVVSAVSIQFRVGVECDQSNHNYYLNNVYQGNSNFGTNYCSCDLGGTSVSTVSAG